MRYIFRDTILLGAVFYLGYLWGKPVPTLPPVYQAPEESIEVEVSLPPLPRDVTYNERTLPLGFFEDTRYYAVTNRQKTFDQLLRQAKKVRENAEESLLFIDLHFNWCNAKSCVSGPVVLANSSAKEVGDRLLSEYFKAYSDLCLVNNRSHSVIQPSGLIIFKSSEPVLVSEFAFIDDQSADMVTVLRDPVVLRRIARAIVAASAGYDKVVLLPGHYRDEGSGPACLRGYDEICHAFDVMDAMRSVLAPPVLCAQITRYGYAGDPYMNDNDRRGIGNRNNKLVQDKSVALSPETAYHLGIDLKAGHRVVCQFPDGVCKTYSVDDSTREGLKNYRLDLYDPHSKYVEYDGAMVDIWRATDQ